MKKIKILAYILLFLFFVFIVLKANFTKNTFKDFFFNKTNTQMNISTGNLNDDSDKGNKFLLKNYKLNNKNNSEPEISIGKNTELFDKNEIINIKIYKVKNNDKYGLVDENGKKLTKIVYDDITIFDVQKGLYKTYIKGKYGLLSAKNGILIQSKYEDIQKTQNNDVLLLRNYKYYGLYDLKKQAYIAKPIYTNIENADKYNWKIYLNKHTGIVFCKDGVSKLIKPQYDNIEEYKHVFKSYIGEKVGLISSQNGTVISETLYTDIELINENDYLKTNLSIFKTNVDDRYGVIYYSPNDLTIVSPIYSDVQYKGRVNVLSGGYWRILDNKGNVTTR